MKYILAVLAFLFGQLFLNVGWSARYDACELRTFKATAYYSPEEGQSFYVKGSLEDDKILNGDGTHGASGRAVFNGMIAAPKSYLFGTRIYVPGRGIGQIEDRGGAIVESGERNEPYDRLDFWAGKGSSGLDAALRFGVRYIDAFVCPKGVGGDELGFNFSDIPLERKLITSLREIDLAPGAVSSWTPILQRYLNTLGYMPSGEESLHYGKQTTAAVCAYQQKVMGILATNPSCGVFGSQTRASLRTTLEIFAKQGTTNSASLGTPELVYHPSQEAKRAEPIVPQGTKQESILADRLFVAGGEFEGYKFGPLAPGDAGHEVRILQRKLQWLGHYPKDTQITGIYDAQTIRAIYAFQLTQGLLVAEVDPSVYGYLGPKTRARMNSV